MESKKQTKPGNGGGQKKSYLTKIEYENFKTFEDVAKAIAETLKTYVK